MRTYFLFSVEKFLTMAETTFNQRFAKVVSLLNLHTDVQISQKIGISRQEVKNYKDSKSPGVEKLALILKAVPSVNPMWLIAGEGKMLIDSSLLAEPNVTYKKIDDENDLIKFAWQEDREELKKLRELVLTLTEELINCKNPSQAKAAG